MSEKILFFMRADNIAFEYELNEFRLSNEIGKSCGTEEYKNNSRIVEWLKNADNIYLVRI